MESQHRFPAWRGLEVTWNWHGDERVLITSETEYSAHDMLTLDRHSVVDENMCRSVGLSSELRSVFKLATVDQESRRHGLQNWDIPCLAIVPELLGANEM